MKRLIAAALPLALAITNRSALDIKPPPDAETSCGPVPAGRDRVLVYALREEFTGLTYYLRRYARDGQPRSEPLDVGWGYDGHAACVVAPPNRGRIAVVFPWVDPYGGTPGARIALVEGARVVERHKLLSLWCWELEPVSIRTTRDGGWVVHFRCADRDDAPIERIAVDRNGRKR